MSKEFRVHIVLEKCELNDKDKVVASEVREDIRSYFAFNNEAEAEACVRATIAVVESMEDVGIPHVSKDTRI